MTRIFKGFFKIIFSFFAVVLCIALVVGIVFGVKGYHMYQEAIEQAPVVEKMETLRSQEHFVQFEQLPKVYIDAVTAAEDHRFWSHGGIDFIAIGRALWNDIRTLSFAEGGSTITQQLAKNEYFTQDKKIERKFAEIFVALDLESAYTKEEIFEFYVNSIYFGSGYYGIYDASQGYFGKEPSELTDYEAVLLAGLPNAPSVYSPDENPDLAKQRMQQVLTRMVECDMVTQRWADDLLIE